MHGIYLTTDLFFSSRVTSLAREHGWPLEIATSVDAAKAKSASHEAILLIVDLGKFAGQVADLLAELRNHVPRMHVVAYGPHVDEAALDAASVAGCDEVLSQGQFNQLAEQILRRCYAVEG